MIKKYMIFLALFSGMLYAKKSVGVVYHQAEISIQDRIIMIKNALIAQYTYMLGQIVLYHQLIIQDMQNGLIDPSIYLMNQDSNLDSLVEEFSAELNDIAENKIAELLLPDSYQEIDEIYEYVDELSNDLKENAFVMFQVPDLVAQG